MRRFLAVLAGSALVAMIVWLRPAPGRPANASSIAQTTSAQAAEATGGASQAEADPPQPAEEAVADAPGPVAPRPKLLSLAAREEPPAQGDDQATPPILPPATLLENMRVTIRQFASRFGENPVGDNSEITAALNGKNPRQVVFLNPEDGIRINSEGQLIDTWDTPYFFHQLSRTEMEIHSAGPDRKLWTADDLVLK